MASVYGCNPLEASTQIDREAFPPTGRTSLAPLRSYEEIRLVGRHRQQLSLMCYFSFCAELRPHPDGVSCRFRNVFGHVGDSVSPWLLPPVFVLVPYER